MKYYRKSNLGFLKYTVIVIMFIFILIISHDFSFIWNGTVLFFVLYATLVCVVLAQVLKSRKEMKEIKQNGRCYTGTVVALVKMNVEQTISRTGSIEKEEAYRLKIHSENRETDYVFSDVLVGKKGQKIKKDVKIYDWCGKTYVECKKSDHTMNYPIEESNESKTTSGVWKALVYVNCLLLVAIVGIVLASIFLWGWKK